MCIKIIDVAYGYNKYEAIKELIEKNNIEEVDIMLCDVIENAQYERERLVATGEQRGRLEERLEIAKSLLLEEVPISVI